MATASAKVVHQKLLAYVDALAAKAATDAMIYGTGIQIMDEVSYVKDPESGTTQRWEIMYGQPLWMGADYSKAEARVMAHMADNGPQRCTWHRDKLRVDNIDPRESYMPPTYRGTDFAKEYVDAVFYAGGKWNRAVFKAGRQQGKTNLVKNQLINRIPSFLAMGANVVKPKRETKKARDARLKAEKAAIAEKAKYEADRIARLAELAAERKARWAGRYRVVKETYDTGRVIYTAQRAIHGAWEPMVVNYVRSPSYDDTSVLAAYGNEDRCIAVIEREFEALAKHNEKISAVETVQG